MNDMWWFIDGIIAGAAGASFLRLYYDARKERLHRQEVQYQDFVEKRGKDYFVLKPKECAHELTAEDTELEIPKA